MRPRRPARLAPVLVGLLLLGSGACTRTGEAQAARQPALPSPEQFFGFQMGADRKLANWDKLHEYYQLLAKSSNRMKLVELGKSSEGRPYIALFISSPANLAKLDQYKQLNARLADPRGLSEAEAKKLVAEGRAVVIQSFALHSSEVAASQTAAEFVYDSLSRTDEEAQRMLDNVISIVMPSINPDGTQMIADWYMKYVGTPHEAAGLPWLYQKYSGHDNNRDGFALNLPESQHLGKLMYREWMPQAYVDHHQMGSGNARLYIPPYAEPIRPDADPLVWREMAWWGAHMGNRLEAAGKTGVIGAAIYSGWGHMGFHWITPVPQHRRHADRVGERAAGDADVPAPGSAARRPAQPARVRIADHHAEPVARRLVARARHRRAAEDCRVGDGRSRRAQPRDRAVEHVPEGHAPDRARGEGAGQGVRHCRRAARSADRQEAGEHAARLRASRCIRRRRSSWPTAGSTGPARSSSRWRSRRPGSCAGCSAGRSIPTTPTRAIARAIRSARTTCPPTRSASSWACAAIRSAKRSRRTWRSSRRASRSPGPSRRARRTATC